MKKYLFIIVPVVCVFLCSFFLLTQLDNKAYDLFLRTVPSTEQDKSVLVVKVDDLAIENVGLFPWTRDILADAIVYLREMGAETVAFDLSFLDRSPAKVDQRYVNEELPEHLSYGFEKIDEAVGEVIDSVAGRHVRAAEAEDYKRRLIEFNLSIRNSLDTSISYVTRNVDEYFSKTLRFFGNAYLTLTMVKPEDILGDKKTFDMSPYNLPWIEENIALKNVEAKGDRKTPERPGFIPALHLLLVNSEGAGFVNADPDPDGFRRRQHLVLRHNGKYYGELAFVPLLKKLGDPVVEVTNSAITLKSARIGKEVKDIRIPRAEDGSVLIKWPKMNFSEYEQISSWDLIGYTRHEAVFFKNLKAMNEAGFFSYWTDGENPLEKYNNAQYIKETLFTGENPENGVTFDTYLAYRKEFLDATEKFLNGGYEETILADVDESNGDVRAYVNDFFTTTRKQFSELLEMRKHTAEKTAGAFCIVGVDATSMTDNGMITFQERYPNVGIYPTIVNMILSEDFLDDTPAIVSILIALGLSVGLSVFINRFNTKRLIIAGLGTTAVSVLSLLVYFIFTRRYIGVVVPFSSVTSTFLALATINFFNTIREKSFLRSAFSRYLSPAVISEIMADPSKLNLGGEKREMTAIFTDVRGFSTISESLDPADLVKLLNMYLTDMSNIILENRGTIDKYEGDAIIAFFGAPIYMADHAVLACRTAIRMKQAEKTLNERVLSENLSPSPLFTRIGINTGDMVVGNMGTPNKMDYTIMGNAVNLAARLEGVNKQYNTRGILISEHTRGQIGDEFLIRPLDKVRVVGVNTPLRLYELLAIASEADESTTDFVRQWEKAIELYEHQDFTGAKNIFSWISEKDPEDRVVTIYIDRCSNFILKQPSPNWDGVFNLTQK